MASLVPGSEYWFLYNVEFVPKSINGKMTTYESLDLMGLADTAGVDRIKLVLPIFKGKFKGVHHHQQQH